MRKKAEEAARVASQSPVERKGEVQEELLEEFLKKEFPLDKFEPVKKGKRGADVIQFVQSKIKPLVKCFMKVKMCLILMRNGYQNY